MMNENWPRWIQASVTKHFIDAFAGFKVFTEGSERDTDKDKEYVEIRMDGPIARPQVNNQYELEVTPNILVTTVGVKDTYKHRRVMGKVLAAFTNGIPVKRYGNGDQDDDSLLGCLQLKSEVRGNYFGQIDTVLKIEQSTVDAEYTLTLAGS